MKKQSSSETLHYDPTRPCCESPAAGDLFPDMTRLEDNKENRGRVASVILESVGIGRQRQQLTIDASAWSECVKHPNFRACYDLSMAKLALEQAM